MLFSETQLPGAFIIDLELRSDPRGFFARAFDVGEFERQGLSTAMLQVNLSFNVAKGTVRGMHYQLEPAAETKLVRCINGAIYDVIVDLRPESPTYLQHIGVTLSAENRRALYVPKMFAHGYQTLTDDAEVMYQVDALYAPAYERGLRYDDPALGIEWLEAVTVVSDKDKAWALL